MSHLGQHVVSTAPFSLRTDPVRAATPVHPQESTSRPADPPCDYQGEDFPIDFQVPFRHAGWQDDRCKVYEAMCETSSKTTRRSAFVRCGRSFWVLASKTDPDLYRAVPETCHDRFCRPCSADRASKIRRNLAVYLGDGRHRFLTLTIKSSCAPLGDQVDHLLDSFRLLRRSKLWRSKVPGGAGFLEITWNPVVRTWHPHLHVICSGLYIPKADLARTWRSITKDSYIVDIRLIRDRAAAIRYVSKYATKPLCTKITDDHPALREAIEAMIGRKTIYTFGSWHRWALLADPDNEAWSIVGSAEQLRNQAASGDLHSAAILAAVIRHPGEEVHVPRGPPVD